MKKKKDDIEDINTQLKVTNKIINSLGSSSFLTNIATCIASYDINEEFESKILNRTKYELPIKNGKVINFKTLEIRDRNIEDFWSFECPVEFLRQCEGNQTNLDCVQKFFNDICCGDTDLIDYHQRLWGYLLTGEVSDRSIHIFHGNGCNGKSSIVNIHRKILSNFSVSLSEDITLKKVGRGASPELMDLLYSRCGSLPESDKKEELNSR